MQKLKAALIMSTVRSGRQGPKAAKYLLKHIEKHGGFDVTVIDPLEWNIPMTMTPLHFLKPEEEKPKILTDLNKILSEQDAYFIVSGEYNSQIPPPLTNLLDHFPASTFSYKTCGVLTYSGSSFGGMRSAVALATMLGQLWFTPIVPVYCTIPKVYELAEDGTQGQKDNTSLALIDDSATKMVKLVDWYARAIKNHKNSVGTLTI